MKPEGRLSLVVALLTLWLLLAACAAPRAAMTPPASCRNIRDLRCQRIGRPPKPAVPGECVPAQVKGGRADAFLLQP